MTKNDEGQKCPKCGSDDLWEVVEITASRPCGTGFVVTVCLTCDDQLDGSRRMVGF